MISVCMATYNGEAFIIRQLESILKQLGTGDEVIIIDDCSEDQTVELIQNLNDSRIKVEVNEVNLGPIANFEKSLTKAQGEYVFLADQDDIWLENKVSVMIDKLEATQSSIITHDSRVVDGQLKILSESWNNHNQNNLHPTIINTIWKNGFSGCMMLLTKEAVSAALPFPASIEMHDQWIALVALLNKRKVTMIEDKLMLFVRHGGNATSIIQRSRAVQLKGRLGTIKAVLSYQKKK